jgi:TPR repeat protein
MVVDVQGVQDLYTDPQIHSTDLLYGDGDLGRRGMGLFFHSHRCNDLCSLLELKRFELPSEFPNGRLRRVFGAPSDDPMFAEIHVELARLHDKGRFDGVEGDTIDQAFASLFHLHRAAASNCPEACVSLARLYGGETVYEDDEFLPPDYEIERNLGLSRRLWEVAAERGNVLALVKTGNQLYDIQSWDECARRLEQALKCRKDEHQDMGDIMWYQVLFQLAKIYDLGGNGVTPDASLALEYYTKASSLARAGSDMFVAKQCMERILILDC